MPGVRPADLAISGQLLGVLLLASFVEDKDLVWLQAKLIIDLQIAPCTICSANCDFALLVCMQCMCKCA